MTTSMRPAIVLHDLLGAVQPWSPNTIRSLMLLHVKKLPFTTRWHSYPDVDPFLSSLGVEPASNVPRYTLPAITVTPHDAPAFTIMDNEKIVHYLEERYPDPPLHLSDPTVLTASAAVTEFSHPCRPLLVPLCPDKVLAPAGDERGAQWFRDTREKRMGRSLEMFAEKMGGEKGWASLAEAAASMAELLQAHGGPFFLGKDVSWADIKLAATIAWFKQVDPAGFDRLMALQPTFKALWLASEPYRPEIPT